MNASGIVFGDPRTILRLPPAGMKSPASWTLTHSDTVAHFIQVHAQIAQSRWYAADVTMYGANFQPGSPYADSPWRDVHGGLWDLGPHALSLVLPVLLLRQRPPSNRQSPPENRVAALRRSPPPPHPTTSSKSPQAASQPARVGLARRPSNRSPRLRGGPAKWASPFKPYPCSQ